MHMHKNYVNPAILPSYRSLLTENVGADPRMCTSAWCLCPSAVLLYFLPLDIYRIYCTWFNVYDLYKPLTHFKLKLTFGRHIFTQKKWMMLLQPFASCSQDHRLTWKWVEELDCRYLLLKDIRLMYSTCWNVLYIVDVCIKGERQNNIAKKRRDADPLKYLGNPWNIDLRKTIHGTLIVAG